MAPQPKVMMVLPLLFSLVLAACGPLGGGLEEKTLYVAPYLVDCVGVAPQQCMLVKEKPGDEWSMYYDRIEGFDYEEGYEYELRIAEERVEDPPADASAIRWTLVEVVSKTRSPVGTTWVLDSYLDSQGTLVAVLPGSEATAKFQEGQVGGNASCNSYFGTYTVDGDQVSVEVGAMTEMYCAPEELMAQEQDYLAALASAASYQMAGDRLQITNEEGTPVLTFSALQPVPMVGTLWQLTGYNNGMGGFVSVLVDTEITAVFGEDGSLGGSAGCNNYATFYELDGRAISVGPPASTMMMCPVPEGIMEQERAYLAALESATAYEIEGQQLTITGADGQKVLAYSVREPTPLAGTPWQMLGYNNARGGFSSAIAGTEITALFGEDGSLSGSAGCNTYRAAYEADGDGISIGPAATTRMMCAEPEGIMEQEAAYLQALQSATAYRIQGDELEMTNSEGVRVVAYVAVAGGAGLDEGALQNMSYKSEWTQSGTVPLTDGEYRESVAPGSATETVVMLTDHVAYGQLNGQDAAAVVLVTDPGGSGTFYDLAVVVERDGQPVHIAGASLGDRVQIQSLRIENNEIVVDMVTQGPNDPMCCPTQRVVQTYTLEGDQLVQTSSADLEPGPDLVDVVWRWVAFSDPVQGPTTIAEPDQYTVEFLADGRVNVKADCNNASGTYTVEGSNITIEIGPVTMAECGPASRSDQFIANLNAARLYWAEGGSLYMDLFADGGTMQFNPGGP